MQNLYKIIPNIRKAVRIRQGSIAKGEKLFVEQKKYKTNKVSCYLLSQCISIDAFYVCKGDAQMWRLHVEKAYENTSHSFEGNCMFLLVLRRRSKYSEAISRDILFFFPGQGPSDMK